MPGEGLGAVWSALGWSDPGLLRRMLCLTGGVVTEEVVPGCGIIGGVGGVR
jgi:hypothetical protein